MNSINSKIKRRYPWIDYMKVLGMYFIIYGHFFSLGNKYVYTFSVALFFMISGLLTKKTKNYTLFWSKTWYNLVVPMLIICCCLFVWRTQSDIRHHTFKIDSLYLFPLQLIMGYYNSLQIMWFVYTLIIIKIIHEYTPSKQHFLLLFLMCIAGITYNKTIHFSSIQENEQYANAIINVTTAYPFFAIGNLLYSKKEIIDEYSNLLGEILIFLVSLVIIYLCGTYNEKVLMYLNDYGNNYSLFLIGGIAGTVLTLIASKWLCRFDIKIIKILSTGSIVTLGFHMIFVTYTRSIFATPSLLDLLLSGLILLLFVPIIIFFEKHFPLVVGKYRFKNNLGKQSS